jgi:uncharacterized protein
MDSKPDLEKCMIFIDKEGNWFYRDSPMIHKSIVLFLYENLHRDQWGRYIITWQGQTCEVDVEDTPYIIQRVDMQNDGSNQKQFLAVTLNDGSVEKLDFETLRIGQENVPYCSVKGGQFEARFLRQAYYQLTRFIEVDEQNQQYYMLLNGERLLLPPLSSQ